jgi:hypothetical protein
MSMSTWTVILVVLILTFPDANRPPLSLGRIDGRDIQFFAERRSQHDLGGNCCRVIAGGAVGAPGAIATVPFAATRTADFVSGLSFPSNEDDSPPGALIDKNAAGRRRL